MIAEPRRPVRVAFVVRRAQDSAAGAKIVPRFSAAAAILKSEGMQSPALYLDPLLPLFLEKNAASTRPVAGIEAATAILICAGGSVDVVQQQGSATRLTAPALCWWHAGRWRYIQQRHPTGETSPSEPDYWIMVVGSPLLEQMIVGSFGESGFVSFLDGFSTEGGAKTGPFERTTLEALDRLVSVLRDRPPVYRTLARSMVTEVLLGAYQAGLTSDAFLPEAAYGLAELLDYIEMHYSRSLRLEELASMIKTSPSHLSRLFTRQVGMPLFEYINRVRIRKASLLLRKTSLSVMQIAIDVGYNNVSFFNRYFRRIMRVSPREYRRSTR